MAEKKEKVVKTTKTVTTTTTTTTTVKKQSWWKSLKKGAKTALILGAAVVVIAGALLIIFGRAKSISSSMENTIAKDGKVFFNRFASPSQGDIVVFRHPETDSVVPSAPDKNYYKMCRMYGPAWCSKSDVVTQKLRKRPIYLSRVYGTPGSIIEIKDNEVYVNNQKVAAPESTKYPYFVVNERLMSNKTLDSLGIKKEDMSGEEDYAETYLSIYREKVAANAGLAIYCLNDNSASKLEKHSVFSRIEKIVLPKDLFEPTVFPYQEKKHWNQSNLGPVMVPQKGKILKLNSNTIALYRRCIEAYENNKVEVNGDVILINGQQTDSYKFKRDYYYVIGDNRSSKDDSRYFGFLPDNHIVGVACE